MKKNIFKDFVFAILCVVLFSGYAQAVMPDNGGPSGTEQGQAIDGVKDGNGVLTGNIKTGEEVQYKDGELLVKFKKGVKDQGKLNKHAKHRAKRLKEYKHLGVEHVQLEPGMKVADAIASYKSDPDVEYAEPNYIVHAMAIPNDPHFAELWGLHNTGQTGGTPNADINAAGAWDLTTGAADGSVVVTVIDTGIDYTHPDLLPNLWVNTGEIPGNGIDDDGNGYIDDVYGINAITGTGNPFDDHGHGTHCAGTIGAAGNNGIGVAGVNWNVKIMACKFLNASGSGDIAAATACLDYVKAMKDRGTNVVATSNSWGGGPYSSTFEDALRQQMQSGILFIAAAGNSNTDNDAYANYPSNFDVPNVIAVAATDHQDGKASFSSYGRRTVHVGAPGVNVYSTVPATNAWNMTGGYGLLSGTSMATPHVSGLAALIRSRDASYDWRALKNLILSGGDPIGSMNGITITGRRINAYNSVSCTDRPLFSVVSYPSQVQPGVPVTISALSINCASPVGPVTATTSGGTVELLDDGVAPDVAAGDGIFTGTWTPLNSHEELIFFSSAGSETIRIYSPLSLGATTLTPASAGVPYHAALTAAGGWSPYTWSIVSGALPEGIALNSSTGALDGTPGAPGAYEFRVEVMDSQGLTASSTFTLNVYLGQSWTFDNAGQLDVGMDIAVDPSGNVFITGWSSNPTSPDYLTVKFDPSGNVLWSRVYDYAWDIAAAIAVDSAGNSYVTGETSCISGGACSRNVQTIKYGPTGNLLWARTYGSVIAVKDIAVDQSGNVYVAASSSYAALLVKYNTSGSLLWAKSYGTAEWDPTYSVAVDPSGNAHLVTTAGVLKYDASGNLLGVESLNGQYLAYDAAGNAYATGGSGTFKYDLAGSQVWSSPNGGSSIALDGSSNVLVNNGSRVKKIDQSGSTVWDLSIPANLSRIAADTAGHVYVGGGIPDYLVVKFEPTYLVGISTGSLSAGVVSNSFSQTLTAEGGTLPYTWSVVAGSVPGGLTLNSATGLLSGVPTDAGDYSFTVQVADSGGLIATKEFSLYVHANPPELWARWLDSPYSFYSTGVGMDDAGNVYVAGQTGNASGQSDIMTAKYDRFGSVLWAVTASMGTNEWGQDIAVDSQGNAYVTGFGDTPTGRNIITMKYDTSGTLVWATTYDGGSTDQSSAIAVDGNGQVYVAGWTYNSSSGGYDYLTIKYDASGTELWVRKEHEWTNDYARGIAVDKDGNVYVTGDAYMWTSYAYRLPKTVKYDTNGNRIWAKLYETTSTYYDSMSGVSVDQSGNVYLFGYYNNKSNNDYRIVKYDPAGVELWSKIMDSGSYDISMASAMGADGNLIVTGYNGSCGFYTQKYDSWGSLIWTKCATGSYAQAVAVNAKGDVAVTGAGLTIKYASEPLTMITTELSDGMVGTPYSSTVIAMGGFVPYTWSVDSGYLPAGLELDGVTGEIRGTSTQSGVSTFQLRATDARSGSVVRTFSLTVLDPLAITTTYLPAGISGSGYGEALAANGGKLPYAWAIISGTLPDGLTLSGSTGVITGMLPPTAGTHIFTVQVTDAAARTATKDLSIAIQYGITASAGAHGGISPSGTVAVNAGGIQVFTIAPDTGYRVLDVQVDGASVGAVATYTFNDVNANHTISAAFEMNVYTITASAGANGTIAPSGTTTVNYGSDMTYTITPDAGYHVADVLVDGVSAGAVTSYTFGTVTTNHMITATFGIDTFTVTPSADANGGISPAVPQTVNRGETASFTVTPNAGYHIALVTGCSGTLNGSVYTTGPVIADCTVSVTFAINTYTVTPIAGTNGSISPSTPQAINHNQTASFTLTPSSGYHIDIATGCSGTLNGSTYTTGPITADCTVTATFAINTYTVTPTAGPNGTISPSTPQPVNYNQAASFTLTPNTGYHIDSVTGCNGTLNNSTYTTGPITADCTVSATFAASTYSLTITKPGIGSGTVTSSPSGINCGTTCSAAFTSGTVVALTASASCDSLFAGWSGGDCSGTGTCITTMDAAKTVTATFNQYITVTVPNGGESWTRGSTYKIRWNYSGNPGSNVKIELLKGGVVNRTITSSTSRGTGGSGSYSWRISSSQAKGSDYTIRVTSTSNSNYKDVSDANFTIQ